MKKFGKRKLALTLACMSALGGKISATDKSKLEVKNPQGVDAVRDVDFRNNSKQEFNNAGRSSIISNLKTGLNATFLGLFGLEFVNEILGIFTKADAWFSGKYSIANSVRQSFAKKVLVEKIFNVLDSFSNILKLKVENCEEYSNAKMKKLSGKMEDLEEIKIKIFKKTIKDKNIDLDESLSRIKLGYFYEKEAKKNTEIEKIKALLNLSRLFEVITSLHSSDLKHTSLVGVYGNVNATAILNIDNITVIDYDNNTLNLFKINIDGNLNWEILGKDVFDEKNFKLMIKK
ncbi:MAG: hypothetical protein IJQ10_04130 [Clostridia bacterium]|nr:hypothetical protein [Clostridia bacterium]